MSALDSFLAQEEAPRERLKCGCDVADTRSDACLECPHLLDWLRLHGGDAILPIAEDFTTNPRSKPKPIIPVSWDLKVFDSKPAEARTDQELAAELKCSWQAIRQNRLKGHGLIRGWLLAGYVRPDKRSAGQRRRWLWMRAGK